MNEKKEAPSTVIDIENELCILTIPTIRQLLTRANAADLISLYVFYYFTAKQQLTGSPHATIDYVSKCLRWEYRRVRRAKQALMDFGLLEDIRAVDPATGKVICWQLRLHFQWPKTTLVPKPPGGEMSGWFHAQDPKVIHKENEKGEEKEERESNKEKEEREDLKSKRNPSLYPHPATQDSEIERVQGEEEPSEIGTSPKTVPEKKKPFSSIEDLTNEVCKALAKEKNIRFQDVLDTLEKMRNWLEQNPGKNHYENHKAGLRNWILREIERKNITRLISEPSWTPPISQPSTVEGSGRALADLRAQMAELNKKRTLGGL